MPARPASLAGLLGVLLLAGVAGAQAPGGAGQPLPQAAKAAPTETTVGERPPSCAGTHAGSRERPLALVAAQAEEAARDPSMLLAGEALSNFGLQRFRLEEYGACTGEEGCYWAELDAQYFRAETSLARQIVSRKPGEKLAIIMDIDETTLSNYCEMKREDFGFIPTLSYAYIMGPDAHVGIAGALRLFRKARQAGVDVFFITGRPGMPNPAVRPPVPDQTAATERGLRDAGFAGWAGLQLRNGAENGMPTIAYKAAERQKIVDRGYRILLSVGDQWSDLLGAPEAEVSVKLPNPFYVIP